MPAGKIAAQAGHAYIGALFQSMELNPRTLEEYHEDDGIGTKVCLKAKNLNQILSAYEQAKAAGLPAFLVTDKNHILPPYFDGSPIITAIGIGPCRKHEIRHITKRFSCLQ